MVDLAQSGGNPLGDSSVADLRSIWGDRHAATRTFGNPDRSRALAVLYGLADPVIATAQDPMATPVQRDELKLPYLKDLADFLAAAWASENGWETQMLVKAIGAAKAQATYLAPSPDGKGGN